VGTLARTLIEELASDPVALHRLRELVGSADGEIPACRESPTPPGTDATPGSVSPLEMVRSGRPCPKHPAAGRWRHATSDVWLCLDCYPVAAGLRGVVIECDPFADAILDQADK
jgi:hypothetical protein